MEPLTVPDSQKLSHVEKLCETDTPYVANETIDHLFAAAIRENLSWHQTHNTFYENLLALEKVSPDQLESIDDLKKIPPIHANFFKRHVTLSIDESTIVEHLTSSGTSGQKTQMFFDAWSIKSARRMVRFIYEHYGFVQPETKVNYLLFAYEPEEGSKVGTTNTNIFLTSFAPANEIFFALRLNGGGHEYDRFGSVETLKRYAEAGLPVRISGFPSFMYFTLLRMEEEDLKLQLHPDSLVLFGGGWKGYADRQIPKEQLYAMIHERLGIDPARMRDAYGSVEHSVPYIECSHHHLHLPIWSRLLIRDVKTLEPLGYGEEGFMHFLTPYITSVPAHSVMMGDMGVLHPASECGCGAETPFFEVIGRAGVSRNKSCAITASELLKKRGV